MSAQPPTMNDRTTMRFVFNTSALLLTAAGALGPAPAARAQALPPPAAAQVDPAAVQRSEAQRRRFLEQQPQPERAAPAPLSGSAAQRGVNARYNVHCAGALSFNQPLRRPRCADRSAHRRCGPA